MEGAKKLRLFGFDLQFSGDNNMNSSLSVYNMTQSRSEKRSSHFKSNDGLVHGKRKCPFCDKEFTNSQALGGHQNAHKRERLIKRRSQIEEKRASIEFYLRSLENISSSMPSQYDRSPVAFRTIIPGPVDPDEMKNTPKPISYQLGGSQGSDLYAMQFYVPY